MPLLFYSAMAGDHISQKTNKLVQVSAELHYLVYPNWPCKTEDSILPSYKLQTHMSP